MKTADADTLNAYAERLLSGQVFMMQAASERSTLGYKPPPSHNHVSALYKAAGKLAAKGNEYVPFAMALSRAGGQYQSCPELLACACEALACEIRSGYTDVIKLASPEPGRRKDAERRYTLREILTLREVMTDALCETYFGGGLPGIGWVEAALRTREGMREWKRAER